MDHKFGNRLFWGSHWEGDYDFHDIRPYLLLERAIWTEKVVELLSGLMDTIGPEEFVLLFELAVLC